MRREMRGRSLTSRAAGAGDSPLLLPWEDRIVEDVLLARFPQAGHGVLASN